MRSGAAAVLFAVVLAWTLRASAQSPDAGAPDCSRVAPGTPDADSCAERAFRVAEAAAHALDGFVIVLPPPRIYPRPSVATILDLARRGDERAQQAVTAFAPVLAWQRPVWTIAALFRQGRIYGQLADAIAQLVARASQTHDEDISRTLSLQVRPIACLAIVRYVRAVRAARAGRLAGTEAPAALERLGHYGATQIAACIAEQQRHDHVFHAFRAADLAPLSP